MRQTVKIGTRGSQLALWQADYVRTRLVINFPEIDFETVIIKTTGDRDQKSSLMKIGGMGVFTKSIEDALLAGKIDIAVHSLKDLPSQENQELVIAAVPQRGPSADVLVSKNGAALKELPQKAQVATGSIRRRSQLLGIRPDLQMQDLRGNINTRLQKLETENWHGIIMAHAALERLQLDSVRFSILPMEQMIPAVSQGAIGVQTRASDVDTIKMAKVLNDKETCQAILAERAVLRRLDSGCQFPIGAHAFVNGRGNMTIFGFVGDMQGNHVIRKKKHGKASEAEILGTQLAETLIEEGALDLIKPFQHDIDQ